jgi:hypothetical protein
VAFVQSGMSFSTVSCTGADDPTTSFNQCSSNNSNLAGNPLSTSSSNRINYNLRFVEAFTNAFKVRTSGVPANSESGLVFGNGAGLASNGTRLIARFVNVPAGVSVFVTVGDTLGTTAGASATLISVTDPTGTIGGFVSGTTGSARCGSSGSDVGVIQVPLAAGAGSATWEIDAANATLADTVQFGVAIAYSASPTTNSPPIAEGGVNGNFAPISTATAASGTAPIPRFVDSQASTTRAVRIRACFTNLLFPYVTNQAGFDTGIAISNTTDDPFGTSDQSGTCTINYFGTTASGGTVSPVTTTGPVEPGKQLVFSLGSGGNLGVGTTAAGFQGYLIAQCQFQFAHGYAFITNGSIAQGYLALVLPTGDRAANEVLDN